jgi:hypothetical protein
MNGADSGTPSSCAAQASQADIVTSSSIEVRWDSILCGLYHSAFSSAYFAGTIQVFDAVVVSQLRRLALMQARLYLEAYRDFVEEHCEVIDGFGRVSARAIRESA